MLYRISELLYRVSVHFYHVVALASCNYRTSALVLARASTIKEFGRKPGRPDAAKNSLMGRKWTVQAHQSYQKYLVV